MVYRYAYVHSWKGRFTIDAIRDYLPSNYSAIEVVDGTLIYGEDDHGWTLDGYVIPRLQSGLFPAREIRPLKWVVRLSGTRGDEISRTKVVEAPDEVSASGAALSIYRGAISATTKGRLEEGKWRAAEHIPLQRTAEKVPVRLDMMV